MLEAIPGVRTDSHHHSMEACHRLSKEGLSSVGKGSGTPRGRPPLDRGLWPPPSRGRPWAGPGLLSPGVLLYLN